MFTNTDLITPSRRRHSIGGLNKYVVRKIFGAGTVLNFEL